MNSKTRQWNAPDKAILVAHNRSGGTFLCHALDSHPQIGCERGEPLHSHEQTMLAVGGDVIKVMTVLHNRPGYHVTMFKATVKQFGLVPDDYVAANDVALLFLTRENMLRTHVSSGLVTKMHPAHSFVDEYNHRRITLEADKLVEQWQKYEVIIAATKARCQKARRFLELTYEQITRDQKCGYLSRYVSDLICDFLGVDRTRLYTETMRRNPQPLSELIANYGQVVDALAGTDYYRFLEEE